MATYLGLITLALLLLAGGATAASCLIPELTVMGIWGIPVLGFALIVGVIFRIAVYYDPRVSNPQKHAYWVAGGYLFHLLMWSSFDRIFVDKTFATMFGTFFGAFVLLNSLSIAEHLWVTSQTHGGVYPTFFEMRRFFFFMSSIVYAIGYLANSDSIITVTKPIVIFFTYANWVHFAAIYSGILHPQYVFASNGTIAERLKAWIRSIAQQSEIFFTVEIACLVLMMILQIIVVVGDVPTRFHLLPKAIFAILAGLSYNTAGRIDPRKPPESSNCANRVVSLFIHFSVEIYLSIYMEFILSKDDPYAFEVHSVTLITLLLLRVVLTVLLIFREIDVANRISRKVIMFFVCIAMYTISSVYFVLMNVIRSRYSIEYLVGQTLEHTFYYIATMSVLAIIAGKYREAVRRRDLSFQVQIPGELNVLGVNENNAFIV